jgi:hypothetical protein
MKIALLDINLLHEQHAALLERQRDPLKLGMLVVLVFAVVLVGLYMWVSGKADRLRREMVAKQAQFEKEKIEQTVLEKDEPTLAEQLKAIEKLRKGTQDRFFCAPVLERVLRSARSDMQIQSLTVSLDDNGRAGLTLDGATGGFRQEPRTVTDVFRAELEKNLKDSYPNVQILLRTVSAGSQMTYQNRQYSTAQFSVSGDLNSSGTSAP